jgi:uncharacterized membrane protein
MIALSPVEAGRKGAANHRAARTGRVRAHRGIMVGLFIGAILIAGSLTLVPGRFLDSLLWG